MKKPTLENNYLANITFSDIKFKGKLMGKSWEQEQSEAVLKRIKILIFFVPILFLYAVVNKFIITNNIDYDLLKERLFIGSICIFVGFFL